MKLSFKSFSIALLTTASVNVFAADVPAAEKVVSPNPAKQAVAVRKAAFTLIANSFKPLGDVSQGKIEYNQADVQSRANRILVLIDFLDHSFPEASNLGEPDTKAKAEIWTKRAEFDGKLKKFKDDVANLVNVLVTEKTASDAFKTAVGEVAKDCKGCHEVFKVK
jgi:cytochrome c556